MNKLTVVTLSLSLTLLLSQDARARTKLVALPERESVTLRLDNPSATLVEEERVLTLQQGENLVDFSWQGVEVDPDRVTLLSVSYPPGEAALVWRIHSEKAWEEKARISYLLSSVDRLITYKGVADRDESTLDLEAFLVLRNFSGEDFPRARMVLDRERSFSGSTSHEETRQLSILSTGPLPLKKTFTWDAAVMPWEPERLDTGVGIPVHYLIDNSAAAGLGRHPLWPGKVRVFQDDGHGGSIFLGEDTTPLVPAGGEMKLHIGDSRELGVSQRKTLQRVVNPRPSPRKVVLYDTEEAIETRAESFKEQPVTLEIIQHLEGEWEMAESSMPYEQLDASTLLYRLELPPRGEATITFRYHRRNLRR